MLRPLRPLRLLLVALALLSVALPAEAQDGAAITIRPTASRFTGLLAFVESAVPGGGGHPTFRRLYEGSTYAATPSDALRAYAELDLDAYSYTFDGYPFGQGQTTVGAWTAFQIAAVKATSWDDLRDRTAGLFPNSVQETLIQAMRDVEPAYSALIWDPYGAELQGQVGRFAAYADRQGMGGLVHRLATFYGAAWPDALPIWIAFHPVPPGEGFSATVVGNVAVSEMPAGFASDSVYASVALHEVAHRLFAEQPPERAWWLRDTMLAGASPSRQLAYRWLDEALATATSNGWAYAHLTGGLDPGPWYDDPVIDRYAHALYPQVAAYLNAGRTFDEAFLAGAAPAFETALPDALNSPDALFPYLSVLVDAPDDEVGLLMRPLRERYRLRGSLLSNDFSDDGVAAALDGPGLTVFVVTRPTPETDRLLRRHLPAAALDAPGEAAYTVTPEGQPVLVLRIGSPDGLRALLDRMATDGLGPFRQ